MCSIKKIFLLLLIFPFTAFSQLSAVKTIQVNCDTILGKNGMSIVCSLKDIIIAENIQIDTIIDSDTIWLYPYFYKDENYQHLHDSMPDRLYHAYFEDSVTLAFTIRYKNTKPDGLVNYYYKNGNVRHSANYQNGKKNGRFIFNYENGVLDEVGEYKKGKEHGFFYTYWSTGIMRSIEEYDMGEEDGVYKFFYPNGQINIEGCYQVAGGSTDYPESFYVGKWTWYYKEGEIKEVQYYLDSIGQKEMKMFKKYLQTHDRCPQFPIQTSYKYAREGNMTDAYIYKDYRLVTQIKYYPDGTQKEVVNFKDDDQICAGQGTKYLKKDGKYIEYYESGKKKTEGMYLKNEKNGTWKTYNKNGELQQRVRYKKGDEQ